MKFKTFYKLFYMHRFKKASGVLKLYLYIVLPIRFLLNAFFFQKKIDLDLLESTSPDLYKKNITTISTKNPVWVSKESTALSAIGKMNSLKITSLLVTDSKYMKKKIKKLAGVLHLHHSYQIYFSNCLNISLTFL